MSFGGYKFAGFRVDPVTGQSLDDRALMIHKARIKSFLTSSSLAQNPWILDPNRLNGSMDFEDNVGAIHALTGSDHVVYGYATFFKYSGNKSGYYLIITNSACKIFSSNTECVALNKDQVVYYKDQNSNYYIGPVCGSCLHSLSLVPFGDLPQEGEISFDFIPSSATRLISCGANQLESIFPDSPSEIDLMTTSIVSGSDQVCFGYAIKDTDIISFCSKGSYIDTSDLTKVFIQIFSIDAFSELYNSNDQNKVLCEQILGFSGTSGADTSYSELETYSTGRGIVGQVFNRQNTGMNMTGKYSFTCLIPDLRSSFESSGSPVIPLSGCLFALDGTDVFENGQYAKGSTKPELMAQNFTRSVLSNSVFDTYANNLLFVSYYICGSVGGYSYPICIVKWDNHPLPGSYLGTGYMNIFIGWDLDNPDIRTQSAWPKYQDVTE